MKNTDLVRQILDLIDSLDNKSSDVTQDDYVEPDSEAARMRQIVSFLNSDETTGYDNTPDERVSSIDSVTGHAGGGMNAPKHPDDIRLKDPRGYE